MYLLLILPIAALEPSSKFKNEESLRSYDYSLRVDSHFHETIVHAEVITPPFLKFSERQIEFRERGRIEMQHRNSSLSRIRVGNLVYLLDKNKGLVVAEDHHLLRLAQVYFEKAIRQFDHLAVGKELIVLWNSQTLGFLEVRTIYPRFRFSKNLQDQIIAVEVLGKNVFVATKNKLLKYLVMDLFLEEVRLVDSFNSTEFLDLKTSENKLYALEKNSGLLELEPKNFNVTRRIQVTGSQLVLCGTKAVIDNTLKLDLDSGEETELPKVTGRVISIDDYLVYSFENSTFYAQDIFSNSTLAYQLSGITAAFQSNSKVYLSTEDQLIVGEFGLGALYLEGKLPDKIGNYSVSFIVATLDEEAQVNYILTVDINLTDLLLIILGTLSGTLVFIFLIRFLFEKFTSRNQERAPIIEQPAGQQENVQPSEGRVFSDRNLISEQS